MNLYKFIRSFVIFAVINCGICQNFPEPKTHYVPIPEITDELIEQIFILSRETI